MPEIPEIEANNHRVERGIRYALIVLAGILLALLIVLFLQYQGLRRQGMIDRQQRSALFLKDHAPLAPSEANFIRPWMTFDYVNKLFALPPDYLSVKLDIHGVNYPRITISDYAKIQKMDGTSFLNQVESVVRDYLPPGSASSTALGI